MSFIIHLLSSFFLACAYYAESATSNSSTAPSSSSSSGSSSGNSSSSSSSSSAKVESKSSTTGSTSSSSTKAESKSSTTPTKSGSSSGSVSTGSNNDDDDDSDSAKTASKTPTPTSDDKSASKSSTTSSTKTESKAPTNSASSSSEPTLNNKPSSTAVTVVTGLYNAASAAAQLTANVANHVVNTAYSVVEPHYNAYQAGVNAEQREINRIVASMTGVGIDNQSLMRANYNGIYNSYASQGLDPTSQIIPAGPMQHLTMGLTLDTTIPDKDGVLMSEQHYADVVDALFREGKVQFYSPGEITSSNGSQILGTAYSQLNRQQLFGLENTIFVQGDVDMADFKFDETSNPGGFVYGSTFQGTSPGGILVVDKTNNLTPSYGLDDVVIHELQHAADNALYTYASKYFALRDSLTDSENEIVMAAAISSIQLTGKNPYDESTTTNFSPEEANSNYVNTLDEVRAYSVNEANVNALARLISQGVENPDKNEDVHFDPIPIEDAEVLAQAMLQSPTLQQIDENLNAFLDFLETKE